MANAGVGTAAALVILLATAHCAAADEESAQSAAGASDQAAKADAAATGARPAVNTAASGLRAYANPATGQLQNDDPIKSPRMPALPVVQRDFSRVWEERKPDGSVLTHWGDQMRMTSVATIDAAGKVDVVCLPGTPATVDAAALVGGAAATGAVGGDGKAQ